MMKRRFLLIAFFTGLLFSAIAQETDKNIVEIIDDLTVRWDNSAKKLESHGGLTDYCRDKSYRDNTLNLLKLIHHYDSSLYTVVTRKYEANQDKEARATLDDIETLERDYTTQAFIQFLRDECISYNDAERNKTMGSYEKEVKAIEKELKQYVDAVTRQIDIIDEHVHHLHGL